MTDAMLSTREAADRLGYDVGHVRRLCATGHLRAVKRGRDWWIPASVLVGVTRRKPGPKPKQRQERQT
jgi:excisionase family DNA binding protein